MPELTEDVVCADRLSTTVQPTIDADCGLILRPWAPRDAPVVFEAYQDLAIQRWHVRTAASVAEAECWIDGWNSAWRSLVHAHWAVEDIRARRIVGRASLKQMDLAGGQAGVAYWAMPADRGRAVVPRAVEALAAWAFGEIGFHRLELTHSVYNQPSCRVAVKTGFHWEGTKYSSGLHLDGWHDMHLHARTN
ncbi:GNAT family N-acetyltransferase [Nocardia sp. NPDC052566]|uniref:GNAT family N-acetyltransferase n=1 Tax=Nocardia sp. NPDC052566 TaxID=3364330 RepID=UPI0037CA01AC